MELFESFKPALEVVVNLGRFLLETTSVSCVLIGFFRSFKLAFSLNRIYSADQFPFNQLRLKFGMWLALALECQLGADILSTTVAPTLESLGELALLAVIRTFLNYFLNKEIETEIEIELKKEERKKLNP